MLLPLIMGFSLMGSVGSVSLAGLFLLIPEKTRQLLMTCLISYATGTLLGAAFLGLIPQALNRISASSGLPLVLGGIILFFILEKVVIWRHCHDKNCDTHGTAGALILIGDAFHNFVDGAIIAATFVASIPLGIATSLAVISHEIPQELGDFAILLESGYKKGRAFLYNIISSLSTFFGAVVAYLFLMEVHMVIGYVMAISASSFIYIAIADLIPSLHRYATIKHSMLQLALILGGIGTFAVFHLGH
ncbi:MAG: ZIP family metal transporter [Thermodesulfobacteriota bacterium]